MILKLRRDSRVAERFGETHGIPARFGINLRLESEQHQSNLVAPKRNGPYERRYQHPSALREDRMPHGNRLLRILPRPKKFVRAVPLVEGNRFRKGISERRRIERRSRSIPPPPFDSDHPEGDD